MKFAESMKSVYITKYAVFKGRAGQSEYVNYFLFQLALFLLSLCLYRYQLELALPVSIVVFIFTFIPGMAVTSRRLHDTGHSYSVVLKPFNYGGLSLITLKLAILLPANWFVFVLVVFFGFSIYSMYLSIDILIKLLFRKGQLEANKYGGPPIH
jgi:uncharacterized membrane protein YhaH (DUF805 family)